MSLETETVVIMRGSHGDLQRVVENLAAHGVEAAIVRPDEASGGS